MEKTIAKVLAGIGIICAGAGIAILTKDKKDILELEESEYYDVEEA
jgi:hypothetical protein